MKLSYIKWGLFTENDLVVADEEEVVWGDGRFDLTQKSGQHHTIGCEMRRMLHDEDESVVWMCHESLGPGWNLTKSLEAGHSRAIGYLCFGSPTPMKHAHPDQPPLSWKFGPNNIRRLGG